MEHDIAKTPPWNEIIFFKGNTLIDKDKLSISYEKWKHELKDDELELNTLREDIDKYEKMDDGKWEYFKKIVNPYELIFTQNKYTNFPQSVCLLCPLSRSYFKMNEMLNLSEFFKIFEKELKIRSAHVCEGPGGFIESLMDECEKHRKQLIQTTAMTLKPNQPNVPGWKRAAAFLHKYRNIRVIYGKDGTGDILKVANQDNFIENCNHKVNIFTSDGGFDFSIDYSSQERFIFPLLLASTRICFEVLKEGGTFIIKFFDIYHEGMKDLVYFLSYFFRSWTLYKPATSRPCNPEQYFIGKGYRQCPTDILKLLKEWCIELEKNNIQDRLFRNIGRSDDFNKQIDLLNKKCIAVQIYYLKQVFDLIEKPDEKIIDQLLKKHEYYSYKWCLAFNAPIYPARIRLIEASHIDQRVSDRR